MPFPGSFLKHSNRDHILNQNMMTELKEKGINYSRAECYHIIKKANQNIADIIINDISGFKLPFGLGYLCVIKFIPKNPPIDWNKTNNEKCKKIIYHNNLHTFGYCVAVKWFRIGRINRLALNEIFMFKSSTNLSHAVSKSFREGKQYENFTMNYFMNVSGVQNEINKRFNKDLKDK